MTFKICFFIWRMWKGKISVYDTIRRWGIEGPSKYWCCQNPIQETMSHVLLRFYTANRTWSYFSSFLGINIQKLSLINTILAWWEAKVKEREKVYFKEIPGIIMWQLWKRRNSLKCHGKGVTL